MSERGTLELPLVLERRFAKWKQDVVWRNETGVVTYRFERGEDVRFLKLSRAGVYPSLAAEAVRLEWAMKYIAVPRMLEQGSSSDVAWLLTKGLPGADGSAEVHKKHPNTLVELLGAALAEFHDKAPVRACPFKFRLDEALAHVRARAEAGLIDPERDFHPEHAHLTIAEAIAVLERNRPKTEDLVVCHGDYCVPNIVIDRAGNFGYVDLGELGIADRWWDLAVASWSAVWNLGPGFDYKLLRAYGIEADPERIAYYRLLYDLAS